MDTIDNVCSLVATACWRVDGMCYQVSYRFCFHIVVRVPHVFFNVHRCSPRGKWSAQQSMKMAKMFVGCQALKSIVIICLEITIDSSQFDNKNDDRWLLSLALLRVYSMRNGTPHKLNELIACQIRNSNQFVPYESTQRFIDSGQATVVEFCSTVQSIESVENGDIFPCVPQIEHFPVCH